jgi:hypothetical protein
VFEGFGITGHYFSQSILIPHKIDVRENIPKGGESRVIDLRGLGKRSLRKIEFWYETKGFLNGKADVTVFGMK